MGGVEVAPAGRTSVGRRRILLGAAGAIGGVLLRPAGPVLAMGTVSGRGVRAGEPWPGGHSANGWPVLPAVPAHRVEGSNATVGLAPGDVATVLLHVARRFSYEVGELEPGDLQGHTGDRAVTAAFESNHLSGTALGVRPLLYPVGSHGGLFPHEEIVLRDILADCEGVVRWGGDLEPVKESHFQVDVPPGHAGLVRVAAKIRSWDAAGDVGAGATDPFAPGRRRAAELLARRQGG